MDTKLYVGNLSYDTTEEDLRSLFAGAGTVTSVTMIKDRQTGISKGFAFVEMSSQNEAEQAKKDLDGRLLGNREIRVDKARPPKERGSSFSSDYNRYGSGGPKRQNQRKRSGQQRRY